MQKQQRMHVMLKNSTQVMNDTPIHKPNCPPVSLISVVICEERNIQGMD